MVESDNRVTAGEGRVELAIEGSLSRDALYAAACTFTDRCFVRLEVGEGDQVSVVLRAKEGRTFDGPKLAEELRTELDDQAFRHRMVEASRGFLREIALGPAVGGDPQTPPQAEAQAAAAPAGSGVVDLDDLRSFEPGDAGDPSKPVDDPLGIAMSWDAKREREAP